VSPAGDPDHGRAGRRVGRLVDRLVKTAAVGRLGLDVDVNAGASGETEPGAEVDAAEDARLDLGVGVPFERLGA
jgi:hypothetical protein